MIANSFCAFLHGVAGNGLQVVAGNETALVNEDMCFATPVAILPSCTLFSLPQTAGALQCTAPARTPAGCTPSRSASQAAAKSSCKLGWRRHPFTLHRSFCYVYPVQPSAHCWVTPCTAQAQPPAACTPSCCVPQAAAHSSNEDRPARRIFYRAAISAEQLAIRLHQRPGRPLQASAQAHSPTACSLSCSMYQTAAHSTLKVGSRSYSTAQSQASLSAVSQQLFWHIQDSRQLGSCCGLLAHGLAGHALPHA